MSRFRRKIERYEAQLKKERYSNARIPVRAMWLAHESQVRGLTSVDWVRRVGAIEELAFEWAATVSTPDNIGNMAVELVKLARRVRLRKNPRDAFELGCMWEQFKFENSPEKFAADIPKASGKKGGDKKAAKAKGALNQRDEELIAVLIRHLMKYPRRYKDACREAEKSQFDPKKPEPDDPIGESTIYARLLPIAKKRLVQSK